MGDFPGAIRRPLSAHNFLKRDNRESIVAYELTFHDTFGSLCKQNQYSRTGIRRFLYSLRENIRGYQLLILSRRTSESIIIGDEVTITVLSVKGKQVRIGIDAPPHIGVHREEIYNRIKAEGEDSEPPATE